MTLSTKVTAWQKARYTQIAKLNGIPLSEWIASIIDMYQNAYGELKINSFREDELLNEIDKLNKKIDLLEAHNNLLETRLNIRGSRI
jgi:hypothetical protein